MAKKGKSTTFWGVASPMASGPMAVFHFLHKSGDTDMKKTKAVDHCSLFNHCNFLLLRERRGEGVCDDGEKHTPG
jgi:hypothetical protein